MPSLQWSHVLQLPGMHKKGITCLAGRMVSDTVAIFASTSSDSIVVIWEMVIEPTPGGKMALLLDCDSCFLEHIAKNHTDLASCIFLFFYLVILTVLNCGECVLLLHSSYFLFLLQAAAKCLACILCPLAQNQWFHFP
jgi:hypothetical protein